MQTIVADIAIIAALLRNEELRTLTSDRIFNTARPENEEKEDNIPYIVVTYEGMQPADENKDNPCGMSDIERVNVLCVAPDRVQLADLINKSRNAITEYLESEDCYKEFNIDDFADAASAVMYDWTVPCVYQSLQYTVYTFKE